MTGIEWLAPDVLGAVTGNARVGMGALQLAVGAAPALTYIGQPLEIAVILQSMIDTPLDVRISLNLPTHADKHTSINLTTPRKVVSLKLAGGEVGVARLPVTPLLPTPAPLDDVPIRIAVRHRPETTSYRYVRAPLGGAPPSELPINPFQLQVLRDIHYIAHAWDQSPELITVPISVAPGQVPGRSDALNAKPRYAALWTMENMPIERERAAAQIDEARFIAADMMTSVDALHPVILRGIDAAFAGRGEPLRPGESMAIAKLVTATFQDRADDHQFRLESLRWFQTLCQVLAFDDRAARRPAPELVVRYLLHAAIFDAVLLGYAAIRPRLRIDLGDRAARAEQANKILTWLAGHVEGDPAYIFMPLALGGLALHLGFRLTGEDVWTLVEALRDAYRMRSRVTDPRLVSVLEILDRLLSEVEGELRERNVK
jgi:hypothetical protein